MIKFESNSIIYTKIIKTNKHKELLLHFTIENDFYLKQAKQKFEFWKNHITEICCDKQFKDNIVTEKYFTGV